jgi:hypothetical protein
VSVVVAPPRRGRRLAVWGVVAAAVVLIALVGTAIAGDGWQQRGALDPESAGPAGTRALARVLAEQGVEVRVVRSLDAARDAVAADTTLVLPDAPMLADDEVAALASGAGTVVLIEPQSWSLRLLVSDSSRASGFSDDPVAPSCDLPAAEAAGPVAPGELYVPGPGVVGCYPVDDGFGLLSATEGDTTVIALDGRSILTNETVSRGGNAALGLAALGSRPTVVWYIPSLADGAGTAAPTLGELTPGWVTPSIVLLVLATVAAGIWRGRRFGPLVAEDLPVTVRVDETTVGRGRLYARSGDPVHAADHLRRATLARLARLVGLSPAALPHDVAGAAARVLGADARRIHDILLDRTPSTDRELVVLSDDLRDLEAAVRAVTRTEGTSP